MNPFRRALRFLAGRRPVKLLVCVYTCAAHEGLLERFYQSPVGQELQGRPGTLMLEVHADPSVEHSRISGRRMLLRTAERYEELSIKTHRMIAFAVREFEFENLLKIDVTTVMTELDSPEYAGRTPMDLQALARFLRDADYTKDYAGFTLHASAGREGAENWARKKGGSIQYQRLFGDGPMPPFYSGKCYMLGRRFAEFVAEEGAAAAEEQREFFLGSEDVMIGRLHQRFTAAEFA